MGGASAPKSYLGGKKLASEYTGSWIQVSGITQTY